MATRILKTEVRFAHPFHLSAFDAPAPAGTYRIEHEEEPVGGSDWSGWLRTASYIHLPALDGRKAAHEVMSFDPAELEAALERDRNHS